ncbi:MAG TPA: NADH-ubiquinone oxidoreductase-F iron-sulfur binding region domain-containing protein [Candidatus Goldiibacteriota bacterium]|nr:NADH-ubiquinone oxidoreductase-F iron-sulfur binding region domain-containing protein [Candidatus Goldiibacteriota bacterium]HRQ43465.1 NADH-ubiquinone oxidoreductase-F iron-sulfur binding region domain-containing protein [Candidatus Goldiibacteriota bacterium]
MRAKLKERRIIICAGTACVANGALKLFDAVKAVAEKEGIKIEIELKHDDKGGNHLTKSGCQGFCQMGPLVTIMPEDILYTKVKPEDAEEIVKSTIEKGIVIERLLYKNPADGKVCVNKAEIDFYRKQHRYVLKQCGVIDPEDITEYIASGGYASLEKALKDDPAKVCADVLESGLRGRGGAGFPTGKKWDLTRIQKNEKKYIICNGDEGDPGAFMDRSVMEGNPHSVIEGMAIAAHAIGADEGFVYVRAEYPLAVRRMKKAVADAVKAGIIGERMLGIGGKFNLSVMEGAGAFVCGEETALMASVEGKRGMPKPKPPFPAQKGLWDKPTVINNVETLATVPLILRDGPQEYKKMGTKTSPGTKTFAVTGQVANTGLIEVPFGTTLREIIFGIAGGVTGEGGKVDEANFKAVQIGGPSGACLTAKHLDLQLDFENLKNAGAMVGSGGLVVMNQSTCMVKIAGYFMQFTQNESCGKCVLCREGTKQMLWIMNDICEGKAQENAIPVLKELAAAINKGSLCMLGKTAPNPVLSTMRFFPEEYEAHVKDKKCPAGECKGLMDVVITPALCKGCGLCAKVCPAGAITGKVKEPYVINKSKCVKCGVCIDTCRFKAINFKGGN